LKSEIPNFTVALLALVTVAASAQSQTTFRADTRLVEVNVVVQDRGGRPVEGLSRADFTLLEDGKPQQIELFNVEASRPQSPPEAPSPGAAPAGAPASRVFTNRLAAKPGGVTVVVLDRLNTRFEDQHLAREQIVKVLGEFQPEDRVALYVLESDTIRILHDFTGDMASLRSALQAFQAKTSRETQAADATPLTLPSTGADATDAEFAAWLREAAREVSNFYLRRRAELTADAFEAIARRLAGVRGRKNLVWVSAAFPLQYAAKFGPETMDRMLDRASRAVNAADIAVYSVDPRGLVAPTTAAAAKLTEEVNRSDRSAANDARVTGLISAATETRPNVDTLEYLSAATGGRAFSGMNDAGQAIRRAVADSRMTYVLGYYPSHGVWDGRYRSIRVTVNRPDVRVLSRRGYLATLSPLAGPADSTETLLAAMRSPFESTGIDLSARVEHVAGAAAAGQLSVVLQFDARALSLEKKDTGWEGAVDVAIAQRTAEGRTFKTFSAKADLRFTPDQHDAVLRDGVTFTRVIALRPDSMQLSAIVRDIPSGAIGSVIIPIAGLR
jgi:VWFA-related protein